jgi:hypothetical protein
MRVKLQTFVDVMTQATRILADQEDFLLNRLKTVDASGGRRYFQPDHTTSQVAKALEACR